MSNQNTKKLRDILKNNAVSCDKNYLTSEATWLLDNNIDNPDMSNYTTQNCEDIVVIAFAQSDLSLNDFIARYGSVMRSDALWDDAVAEVASQVLMDESKKLKIDSIIESLAEAGVESDDLRIIGHDATKLEYTIRWAIGTGEFDHKTMSALLVKTFNL
jgi:hypothetical protein